MDLKSVLIYRLSFFCYIGKKTKFIKLLPLKHGIWGNLNLCSWALSPHIWLQYKASLIPSRWELCLHIDTCVCFPDHHPGSGLIRAVSEGRVADEPLLLRPLPPHPFLLRPFLHTLSSWDPSSTPFLLRPLLPSPPDNLSLLSMKNRTSFCCYNRMLEAEKCIKKGGLCISQL